MESFNLKFLVIHFFNNNSLYYYAFTIASLTLIWIIFSFFYLKLVMRGFINYIDHTINTDFKNPEEWLKKGVSNLWVATSEKEIVGSIGIIPFEKEKDIHEIKTGGKNVAELRRMYVSPSHLRKGIGSKLIKELERWCLENEYDEIVLTTTYFQVDAINFYKMNGYKVCTFQRSGFFEPNFVSLNKLMCEKKLS